MVARKMASPCRDPLRKPDHSRPGGLPRLLGEQSPPGKLGGPRCPDQRIHGNSARLARSDKRGRSLMER